MRQSDRHGAAKSYLPCTRDTTELLGASASFSVKADGETCLPVWLHPLDKIVRVNGQAQPSATKVRAQYTLASITLLCCTHISSENLQTQLSKFIF